MLLCQCGCGFGRQGRGFESGSWFLRDVGLSLQLWFGGVVGIESIYFLGRCGFESTSLFFWGWGDFFKFCFVWVVVVVLL